MGDIKVFAFLNNFFSNFCEFGNVVCKVPDEVVGIKIAHFLFANNPLAMDLLISSALRGLTLGLYSAPNASLISGFFESSILPSCTTKLILSDGFILINFL